jgi:hypothetical protein
VGRRVDPDRGPTGAVIAEPPPPTGGGTRPRRGTVVLTGANRGIIHHEFGHRHRRPPGDGGRGRLQGAIEGVARSLRIELRETDVAVTLMQPPLTATRMTDDLGYPE